MERTLTFLSVPTAHPLLLAKGGWGGDGVLPGQAWHVVAALRKVETVDLQAGARAKNINQGINLNHSQTILKQSQPISTNLNQSQPISTILN